ncbi:serine hydrolase domain-containing protein [Psychroserpens algicola]|uniref:Beta-lactamase family protein n=1 Tax=Psychroserpens algicola TaxID=1719034 RepID=A0ABT0HBF2_9FLAO|nr:serine hydrolase domain-containing protein [Psychroserpens algicola]MCK8481700.1 beta-lactamase family protein [Psychroserpens algicola]
MKQSLTTILFLTFLIGYGQTSTKISSKVDDYLEHLIERQGIPGVSIAIVRNGETLYKNNYGYANIEHQVPISDKSIFRLYSLTKPMISVGIFQLIEQEKINLEDVISTYIQDIPDDWNDIKIKHLLSHSSGLPDMAPIPEFRDLSEKEAKNKVFAQKIKFDKGSKYDYNQTGFWLLQKVIENVTDESLAAFILKNQFDTNTNSFFSSDSRDIIFNRTTPYFPFEKGTIMIDHSYLQGDYAYAMNGLNITLNEFIDWDKKLKENKLLNDKSINSMWMKFPYTESNKNFTFGWDNITLNNHESYGFSGSLCTAYRIFPDKDLSIIFLSNGLSNWYNIDNIVNHIASLVDDTLLDINNLAYETILRMSYENKDMSTPFQQIKKSDILRDNNFETHLNDVGYFWLYALKNSKKSIDVFKLNVKEHPKSWNVYDSLAEAYETDRNYYMAVHNYKKSLKLNPDKQYQERIIEKIKLLKEK